MLSADLPNNEQTFDFHHFINEGRLLAALNEAVQQAQSSVNNTILASQWHKSAAGIACLVGNNNEAHAYFKCSLKEVSEKNIKYYVHYFSAMRAIGTSDALGAAKSFSKMVDKRAVDSQRREGLAGLALLCLFLGDTHSAALYSELLIKESTNIYAWFCLGKVIMLEVSLMENWKSSPVFHDHLYWHQDATKLQFKKVIGETAQLMDNGEVPFLLAARYRQLVQLESSSSTHSISNSFRQLQWGVRDLANAHLTKLRLEIILSSIYHKHWKRLGQLITAFDINNADYSFHNMIQIYYCLYKYYAQQGETEKAKITFQHYIKLAAKLVRLNGGISNFLKLSFPISPTILSDEFSARLPAKYRRAYQYMQANIGREDLSIEDIAASIKVTTRALQLAFKKHLGESPAQVLRKIRIEHVHADLLATPTNGSIMDVANKYGINNRTSLINQYRRLYSKLPSSTQRYGLA